jgi:hypothetical protein
LIAVENRLARLAKLSKKNLKIDEQVQLKVLPSAKTLLEEGKALREMNLSSDELNALKDFVSGH